MSLLQAIELLENGDWDGAHSIAQETSDNAGCWLHAVLHKMDGDMGNARYWYTRINRLDLVDDDPEQELEQLKELLSGHLEDK